MSNLPNKRRRLDPNLDPVRSSRRVEYIGNVPGVPEVTDRFFDAGAETHLEEEGNMGVNLTVHVRSTDKSYINEGHYVWMNNLDKSKPKLNSLAQVNQLLFNFQTAGPLEKEYLKFRRFFTDEPHKTKAFIFDHFVPYGTLAVRDRMDETKYSNNTTNAHTVVAYGQAFVLDYWSYKGNKIKPYSHLYYVLKKVEVTYGQYNTKIQEQMYEIPQKASSKSEMVWQIVPFFSPHNKITMEDYTTYEYETVVTKRTNDAGEEEDVLIKVVKNIDVGFYWYLGRVHETQKLVSSTSEMREPLTTSRNTTALYMANEPMLQIYLLKDRKNPLFLL